MRGRRTLVWIGIAADFVVLLGLGLAPNQFGPLRLVPGAVTPRIAAYASARSGFFVSA